MGGQPVQWVECKPVVYNGGPGLAPSHLRRRGDPRNGHIGATLFRPTHRGILDRHRLEVGAELHAKLPLGSVAAEKLRDRFPKPIRLSIHGKGRISECLEFQERREPRTLSPCKVPRAMAPESRTYRQECASLLSAEARHCRALVTERLKYCLHASRPSRGDLLCALCLSVVAASNFKLPRNFLAVAEVNAGPFARTKS
jgi:hypothetical protein